MKDRQKGVFEEGKVEDGSASYHVLISRVERSDGYLRFLAGD